MAMPMIVVADEVTAAQRAAEIIGNQVRLAVAERGRALVAVSGGRTPWLMLGNLTSLDLPWALIDLLQVDERCAPDGSPDRNLTHLRECLAGCPVRVHAVSVEGRDPDEAAAEYALLVSQLAGPGAVLDVIHLGLGDDGHTASLVPGDPVLDVTDRTVAATGEYRGYRRITLTYPVLAAARHILWLATGADKASMVARLVAGDQALPAGRVSSAQALLLADAGAAADVHH